MNKEFLTVSQLNNLVQNVIQAGFPQPLWICGEIQGYNRNRGKNHIFFELVEKDPDSKDIIAKIGLVLFSGRKGHINDILKKSENAFKLKDDIEVKFACTIDFYPPHGAVRLIIESIDPTYTLGRFAQEKQKLIELLTKKGVFEENKKHELPLVPLKVGLITADDSAAYNDFYAELEKSGIGFQIYLRNALMQGKKAEKDICKAISELDKMKDLDVIVITRGGGSIADLSCFDSQIIAEKIAKCRLPVISGIGHEINVSITDMAAHTYCKTPTAVAQFLIGRIEDFLGDLDYKLERIVEGAEERIESEKQALKELAGSLQENTRAYLKDHQEQIIRIQEIIRHRPKVILKDRMGTLKEYRKVLGRVTRSAFESQRRQLANYQKMIDIVHPANTIKRGFSITRTQDGKIVKKAGSLKQNQPIHTEVADGIIESKVERLKKGS